MKIKLQRAIECLLITILLLSCSKNIDNITPSPKGKIKKYTYLSNINGSGNYYYNNDLKLSEYKWISPSGFITQHIIYMYSNNYIKEVNIYGSHKEGVSPEILVKQEYYYGNTNTLEFIQVKDMPTDKVVKKFLFTANDKLQITNCTLVNLNPVQNFTSDTLYYEYEYDSIGNLITYTTKKRPSPNENLQIVSRKEYRYDNKKNPYQWMQSHFLYDIPRYISPNNVIREVSYGWEGERYLERQYEYEYDIDGKPVKENYILIYENGYEQNSTTVASIEYY